MALEAQNLGVAFGDDWVFRNLSFRLGDGNRVALTGPSGSGKSLLLRCLAMLHRFDEGVIKLDDKGIDGARVPQFRSEVMYVPQRSADVDGSVEDYLEIPFSFAANASRKFRRKDAIQHLRFFDRSESFLEKTQRELSGGERQIATLVRALLLEPRFLLLDEPTSAMDAETSKAAQSRIDLWAGDRSGRGFVWVTHDEEQAKTVASTIVRFRDL